MHTYTVRLWLLLFPSVSNEHVQRVQNQAVENVGKHSEKHNSPWVVVNIHSSIF